MPPRFDRLEPAHSRGTRGPRPLPRGDRGALSTGPALASLQQLQRTVGNQAVTELLTGQRASPGPAPSPVLIVDPSLQQPFTLRLPDPGIEGPLPPGTALDSQGLSVRQPDAQHVEIDYGASWVRIAADPGDVYAFAIGPPIEGPPRPAASLEALVTLADQPAKPELPQRLVRVAATRPVVDQQIDPDARVPPIALQTRYGGPDDIAQVGADIPPASLEVLQTLDEGGAQLQLEDTMIRIEVAPSAPVVAGDAKRAHFAYWVDPEWTGPQATDKRVVIVAAPGVVVHTGTPAHSSVLTYGRKLAPEIVRVPHPNLVPEQGTRFSVEQFAHIDVVDPDAPDSPFAAPPGSDSGPHRDEVDIATGLSGTSIVHPSSGARLTLTPADPEVGGAYAWQVLPPASGAPGEIRAVVGPGVEADLEEPVPQRLRDPSGGPTPTPRKGQAQAGEGLEDQAFELKLVEVGEPSLVPPQGVPLNIDYFLQQGGRFRDPDRHRWLGTDDLPFMLASAGADLLIGSVPIVGQLYLIGEFAYTMATGHDWWGNEVDDAGKAMMGVGAAISLLPLVGGLGSLLRGAAKASVLAEFAARWGVSVEELQAVLVRVGVAAEGDDAVIVQKAMRAIERGEELAQEDLPGLQRVLAKVGAGRLGIEGIARSGLGRLDLALASAGEALQSENYLANLMSAIRTTGEVPEALAVPLARSGQFGTAEEAAAAVQQALRDLARAEGVAADESLIAQVAHKAGEAMAEVQAAGTLEVASQTRALAVSQPQLVARYEDLAGQRLPAIVDDVLRGQGTTPTRTRLAALRGRFEQLRAQVGSARQLTDAQRDLANDILREARDLARDDFKNVQQAVWRRLRNPRRNPDLAAIEQQLRAAGDVQGPRTGAMRLRMVDPQGATSFESMNLEHRVRLSDNPWLYNDPENVIASDSAQNQQYLEGLRKQGSIWPSDAVEEFVVRFGLNDEGIDFQPHSR